MKGRDDGIGACWERLAEAAERYRRVLEEETGKDAPEPWDFRRTGDDKRGFEAVIGFATEFYTLWRHDWTTEYVRGEFPYREERYTYLRNISRDEGKAVLAYPDARLDTGLRGTSSFTVSGRSKAEREAEEAEEWRESRRMEERGREMMREISASGKRPPLTLDCMSNLDDGGWLRDGSLPRMGVEVRFADFVPMEYNGYEYSLPSLGGRGKMIKGRRLSVDGYDIRHDEELDRYSITVTEFRVLGKVPPEDGNDK